MLNKSLSSLARSPAYSAFYDRMLGLLERADTHRPNYLQVLTYHLIGDAAGFDEQMGYLARRHSVVSVHDVLAAFEGRTILPSGAVMLTFDDAYQNFAEVAWPILKKHRLPVTLFVPTAYPDRPDKAFWWDRLDYVLNTTLRRDDLHTPIGQLPLSTPAQRRTASRRLKRYLSALPHKDTLAFTDWFCKELASETTALSAQTAYSVLGWEALRSLAAEGVSLGAHTRTHPLLNQISIEEAQIEAAGSLQDLKREVPSALPIFAYPGGRFSNRVVADLKHSGYALAFTTIRGTNVLPDADPLRIRRNNIGHTATLPVLRTRLLHASAYLNRFRPLAGRGSRGFGSLPKPSSYHN